MQIFILPRNHFVQTSYSYFLDNIGPIPVLTEELYPFYFSLTWRDGEDTWDDCLNQFRQSHMVTPQTTQRPSKAASYKACYGVGPIKNFKMCQVHVPFPMFYL